MKARYFKTLKVIYFDVLKKGNFMTTDNRPDSTVNIEPSLLVKYKADIIIILLNVTCC